MRKEVKILDEDNYSRLSSIIKKNRENSPEYMADVIKSDFFYLINNYFEVDFNDINVEILVDEKNNYNINLTCLGDRIKLMRRIDN